MRIDERGEPSPALYRESAKEKNRLKIIEYIANPNNTWPTWTFLSTDVCGYKRKRQLFEIYTVAERKDIETEALQARRSQYSKYLADVDLSLIKAATAEVKADLLRLVYQRFEDWAPREAHEFTKGAGAKAAAIVIAFGDEIRPALNNPLAQERKQPGEVDLIPNTLGKDSNE